MTKNAKIEKKNQKSFKNGKSKSRKSKCKNDRNIRKQKLKIFRHPKYEQLKFKFSCMYKKYVRNAIPKNTSAPKCCQTVTKLSSNMRKCLSGPFRPFQEQKLKQSLSGSCGNEYLHKKNLKLKWREGHARVLPNAVNMRVLAAGPPVMGKMTPRPEDSTRGEGKENEEWLMNTRGSHLSNLNFVFNQEVTHTFIKKHTSVYRTYLRTHTHSSTNIHPYTH